MMKIPPAAAAAPGIPQSDVPDPKYLAMAAAMVHQEGRLFEPAGPIATTEGDVKPKLKASPNVHR